MKFKPFVVTKSTIWIGLILFVLLPLFIIPSEAAAAEDYRFERMWPTLQQPWYFNKPMDTAIDDGGNIYVVDMNNYRIEKFTPDGKLITSWGSRGAADGAFNKPRGIAIDADGNVYVTDTNEGGNFRVQKFTSYGQFLLKWGTWGSGDGEFYQPRGIAVDGSGNVYVADWNRIQKFTSDGQFIATWENDLDEPEGIAVDSQGNVYVVDLGNHRVQKFTSDGQFLTEWGSFGAGNGEFNTPTGIAVDPFGNIYVTDYYGRMQTFTSDGQHLATLGSYGFGDGQFLDPGGIAIDSVGNIYVADMGSWRIQKFTPEGGFITKWSSKGSGDGEFSVPRDLTVDASGNIYVADASNHRIQKFTPGGRFITKWGVRGSGEGQLIAPLGLTAAGNGYVYVADTYNHRIQKFTAEGQFVSTWGSEGSEEGAFGSGYSGEGPNDIAIDDENGFVLVADTYNHRIQKFTADGTFTSTWGVYGTGAGEFKYPEGIAVDANGNVYVADTDNHRVQKFSGDGQFLTAWGEEGSGNGQFNSPHGIAFDEDGSIYVADTYNHRIQVFAPDGAFISAFSDRGTTAGQVLFPFGLGIGQGGRIYVCDDNNRVQVFKKVTVETNNKAIVVAGGGGYQGNNLWDATQMCANFSYQTLVHQGFSKQTISYLSSNTALDLDNNGVWDDVDGDATGSNLQNAITNWASDAHSVLVYLTDHGGDGTFRMSGTETLSAANFDSWVDQLQQTLPGKVVVIYDACESGSFLAALSPPPGKERIIISSTSPSESAYFVSQGSISFSNYFWTHVFNGLSVYDAFDLAEAAIGQYQNPLLDDNGNGIGNESGDGTLARAAYIGNGTLIQGEAPIIETVSSAQVLNNQSSATLSASGVTDDEGIARVWAIIRPPDYAPSSPGNPVQEFPSLELMAVGDDRYEGHYDAFTIAGIYQIAIYARDRIGNTSLPKLSSVSVNNPLSRKAIIVAGGAQSENLWPAIESNAVLAYEALTFQGYGDEDIYFMSPVTISAGVDGLPTISNLRYATTTWASQNTQDVVLYLIGNGDNGTFQVSETENLSAATLGGWLNTLQNTISGKVTVMYDGCRSGSFIPALSPPAGKERILLSSTGTDKPAYFLSEGSISFSKYFWNQVLNGADVRESFIYAKQAVSFSCQEQTPTIDDNGNGIGNEREDGQLARNHTLGAGIMLAGDTPIIGSICSDQTLEGGASATIWVDNVTTTGSIEEVWAVITPPNLNLSTPSNPVTDLPTLELPEAENGRYEGTYSGFTLFGTYAIAVYAVDRNNAISLPQETSVSVPPPALNVSSLTSDLTGAATAGEPLNISFTANGQGTPLAYQYFSRPGYQTESPGPWELIQTWSTNNTLPWTPPCEGHYVLIARVTDDPPGSSFHQAGLSIETSGNRANPIQITDFTTNLNYPQSSGEAITVQTTATGGSGPLQYRYYYRKGTTGPWREIRGYSVDNRCTWTPPDDGFYTVVVHVTDTPSGNTFSIAGMTCTIGN